MDQIKTSMVNPRGRVVWIDQDQVREMAEKGWRIIQNPKEDYYPQYDQSLNQKKKDDDGKEATRTKVLDTDLSDHLGIIVF